MRLIQSLILISVLSLGFAGASFATPVHFQYDSQEWVGGILSSQTWSPAFPILGTGDLNLETGLGTLFLDDHSFVVDALADGEDDARFDITGWSMTITSVDASGNLIATGAGSVLCTSLGTWGDQVCGGVFDPVDLLGWPTPDGSSGHLSSAVIDLGAQTITVIDASSWDAAGTGTGVYSYSEIPEPSAALLVGLALVGMYVRRRGEQI